jgi:hypothetical protein
VLDVLALNSTQQFLCDHRRHPAHLVTSGLTTVILTVHQKCAVILSIKLTWQDKTNIKISITCNKLWAFWQSLVDEDCVK